MTVCAQQCELCGRELHGDATAYLCPGCTRATAERLQAMPGLYVALEAFLVPGRHGGDRTGSAARTEAPLPACEPVLDLRGPGGIVGILEGWRSALHETLGWTEPVPRGSIPDRVKRAADGLHVNMLFIAASWSAAGAMAEEVRDLHRDITSIVSPREQTRRLGYCPTIDTSGVICGAVVGLPPAASTARCAWCGTSWPPERWVDLRLAQRKFEADRVAAEAE